MGDTGWIDIKNGEHFEEVFHVSLSAMTDFVRRNLERAFSCTRVQARCIDSIIHIRDYDGGLGSFSLVKPGRP